MISYFFAFFWGIYILLSLMGWGGLVNRFFFPNYRVDWGQKAAWGIAFSIVFGGVLNVTWKISPATILIYLGLGFLYWLADFYKNRQLFIKAIYDFRTYKNERIFTIGLFLVILIIFVHYAGYVHASFIDPDDDAHGYFVFPYKMLQMGSMGAEPFSGKRLFSSLGGNSFLETFIISTLDKANLMLFEGGIALIALVGLIVGYCQEKNLSKKRTILILLFFLIIPRYVGNSTSTLTAAALFFSLVRTLCQEQIKFNKFNYVGVIALIVAATCASKSVMMPACILLIFLNYVSQIIVSKNNRQAVTFNFIILAALVFVLLLPWMISLYQSSGTLLYPILGKGYHGSVYSEKYLAPNAELTVFKAIELVILVAFFFLPVILVFGFINLGSITQSSAEGKVLLPLVISAVSGSLSLALTTGGESIPRYLFPVWLATLLILLVNACKKANFGYGNKSSVYTYLLMAMLTAFLFIPIDNGDSLISMKVQEYRLFIGNIRSGLSNISPYSDQKIEQYTKMQYSIPESETVLVLLDKPFILNFKRNRILMVDGPGESSLPPGMPFFKGGEALADYLTSHSIRYVAFSYKEKDYEYFRLIRPEDVPNPRSTWYKMFVEYRANLHDNLSELGETRKRIYDDGELFVLDLLSFNAKQDKKQYH